jgi:hypothetical protein
MKVGVLKIGARVQFSNKNSIIGGVVYGNVRAILNGGSDCVVFTKILESDVIPSDFEVRSIFEPDTSDIDVLFVINGLANVFFGGKEDECHLHTYKLINKFKGPVYFLFDEPKLPLAQVYPIVMNKPWGHKYSREDLEIVREDIVCISQGYKTEAVREFVRSKGLVSFREIKYWPSNFAAFLEPSMDFNKEPTVDLMYGGSWRQGNRANKLTEYYFGWDSCYHIEMFGKIKHEEFNKVDGLRPPVFTEPVSYFSVINKMNTAKAHVVVGDPLHERFASIANRAAESVQAGCITFIDKDLDPEKRFYNNKSLDFLYVKSKADVKKIIDDTDRDNSRKQIIDEQIKSINFDRESFSSQLLELFKL